MDDLFGHRKADRWAERFASEFQVIRKSTGEPVDTEGLMLAWFASAIETGVMIQTQNSEKEK